MIPEDYRDSRTEALLSKVLERETQASPAEAIVKFVSMVRGVHSPSAEALYAAEGRDSVDFLTVIPTDNERLQKELYQEEDKLQWLYPSLAFTFTVVSRQSPTSDLSLTSEQIEKEITALFPKAKRVFLSKS